MATTKDPSKDPGMLCHYISHAFVRARFALQPGEERPDEADRERGSLIATLKSLNSDPLVSSCVTYLESHTWKTIGEIDETQKYYDSIDPSQREFSDVLAQLRKKRGS